MTKGYKHGLHGTHEYNVWLGIKKRCFDVNYKNYDHYGGRGISVCDSWANSVVCFVNDMGRCPDGYQIDRIDNNKGYSLDNCRWASRKTNTRNTPRSKRWVVDGKTYGSAQAAADAIGVSATTIRHWCQGRINRGKRFGPKEGCSSAKKYKHVRTQNILLQEGKICTT